MVGNAREADRAEEDAIVTADLLNAVFRHHAAGLGVGLAAPVILVPFELDAELAADCVENPDALGDDLVADSVAGDHGDLVLAHE